MEMQFCVECEQNVTPAKVFNWLAFILLFLLFGTGGLVYLLYGWIYLAPQHPHLTGIIAGVLFAIGVFAYLLYFWFLKTPQCPMCGGTSLRPPRESG